MIINNEFLINYRKIIKLYEFLLKDLQVKYNLTKIEMGIIGFLHNNPTKNTASNIVELRMLQKGNVSSALNLLESKSLLTKTQDEKDSRVVSLFLTKNSKDITNEIDVINEVFQRQIFDGFSNEDIKLYSLFNNKILNNINEKMKGNDFFGK